MESVRSPRRGFSTVSLSRTCSASCTAVVGSLSVVSAYSLLLHSWCSNISLFLLRNEQLQRSVCLQSWSSRKIRCQWDHLGNTWFNQSSSQSFIFAILVIVPNVMGFATWSPPLDAKGNSARGIMFFQELVKVYRWQPLKVLITMMSIVGVNHAI